MIEFARHVTAPRERDYVARALASGHTAGDGPFSRDAAAALAEQLDDAEVLLTPSGTHALEMMALLLDIGPGDQVVMPSFTFSSTANAFALRGARIRFADIDEQTFSMELPQLEAALTGETRLVVAVHYGGIARDIAGMRELCTARGVPLVEDNAHGLFASTAGQPLGTFGRLAALSMHQTKNISCGEGGALVVNDASLLSRARMIREKGTNRTQFLRGEVDKYTWQTVGSSYLLSEILAAVLLAQLEHASDSQVRRLAIYDLYRRELEPQAEALGLALQSYPPACVSPAHLLALVLPERLERRAVIAAMRAAGVAATSHYEPLHLAPAGREHDRAVLTTTERIAARLLRLPLHAQMTDADAGRAVGALIEAMT